MKNRTEQYNHLRHALDVMRKVDNNTFHPVIFLKMFLIEEGLLPFYDKDLVRFHAKRHCFQTEFVTSLLNTLNFAFFERI